MKIKNIVAATALAAASFATVAPANAAIIQLGFIIDESGSIGSTNYTTIKTGLHNAIDTLIPIGGDDTYEITVVAFGSAAQTVVAPTLITNTNIRGQVADLVLNDPYADAGSTNYAIAFSTMQTLLTGSTNFSAGGLSYVNFATDGSPNAGGTTGVSATQAGINAFNSLILAGINNVSVEGIGVTTTTANLLKASFCYPTPCDSTDPFNFPTQGFYIGVPNADAYADAIGTKIRVVTGQVPEPGALALLGIGLVGLAAARRRKQAA